VRARRDLDAGDPDSALVHAENAMVNAADAVLARYPRNSPSSKPSS
jgi:HEPN domain-containing protein